MKPSSLLTLLLCLCLTSALSQGLNFININTDNGLPSNECYRIVQDKKGYIWIATDGGLVRYNSKDFVVFNAAKGLSSINDIYALDVDEKGRVWFATGKCKIGYILNDSITVLPDVELYLGSFADKDMIYKIRYDNSLECLYVSTNHQTITLKEIRGIYTSKPVTKSGKANCQVYINNGYTASAFGKFLYSYGYSFYEPTYFVDKDSVVIPTRDGYGSFVRAFTDSINANEICLSNNYDLHFFNRQQQKFLSRKKLTNEIISLKSINQMLMVGCKRDGLYIFKSNDINSKPIHLLHNLSVSNIIQDHEGAIWVTTLEKGIFYCPNPRVSILEAVEESAHSFTFSKVVNNTLFLSNHKIPLAIVDKETTIFSRLGLQLNPIVTDVVAVNNDFYIGTAAGSYLLNKPNKKITELYNKVENENVDKKIVSVSSKGLLTDSFGNCYNYNNVYILKFNKQEYKGHVTSEAKIKYTMLLEPNKALICSDHKLFMYSLFNAEVSNVQTPLSKKLHDINKTFLDSYGNCWVLGNYDSILILNKDFGLKQAIFLRQKSISSRDIIQVNDRNFYIATNKGLCHVSFKSKDLNSYNIQYFDQTNGLNSSDVYKVFLFNDKLHVSTSKGICFVDKIQLLSHTTSPKTVIKSCWVNDSLISGSLRNGLAHHQNNISFQIDALTFKKIGQRGFFYKYKLQGWDKEFKTATGNTVSYSNLPPGDYTFIAKAFYDNDTEDPTPATFSFTIKPAFWQTWWGTALIILSIIGLIFLFVQWRIKKIRQVEAEKTAINQTIAEYRFTALKAQMDPHFVFNSINVIQNLILEKDKTEAYNSLNKFSKLIRMILNQSDSVFATLEEEMALINMYVELNQLRVEYPFTFKTDIQPQALSCSIPSLIIQPFIENALWHGILPLKGKKEGLIQLTASFQEENVLTVQVQDNGIGRKAAMQHQSSLPHVSKGTELIRERLKAYQTMNNNCIAELNIVDLEEDGVSSGTLVEIKIAILHNED